MIRVRTVTYSTDREQMETKTFGSNVSWWNVVCWSSGAQQNRVIWTERQVENLKNLSACESEGSEQVAGFGVEIRSGFGDSNSKFKQQIQLRSDLKT